VLATATLGLAFAGCAETQTFPASDEPAEPAKTIRLEDGYAKAAEKDGQPAMSAIFGMLRNPTSVDVTVVSAMSDAAATVELHETAMENGEMKMRPKEGGFRVPAGQSLTLEPGALHIMLIGLTRDLPPGAAVDATLTLADGQQVPVHVTARDLANANETYAPDAGGSSNG
jgi:periplasmic copper chaperone A